MKTITELNALIPTLVELLSKADHEIGKSYWDNDEDGPVKCEDYEDNCFIYDDNGWCIEVTYQCCGEWDVSDYYGKELIRAWGKVTGISASYSDDDSGEFTEFSNDDLKELEDMINSQLRHIA